MESSLSFRIVGGYRIAQTDWRMGEDRPREDCCKCHNAKYASILVKINKIHEEDKFVCVECLLANQDIKKIMIATLKQLHLDGTIDCNEYQGADFDLFLGKVKIDLKEATKC